MIGAAKKSGFRISLLLLILCIAAPECLQAGTAGADRSFRRYYSIVNFPNPETPANMREIWLRFHEEHICEDVGAIFLFRGNGMELIVDKSKSRDLKKLGKLLKELGGQNQIKMYLADTRSEESENPEQKFPVSFRLNENLRSNLGDPKSVDFFRFNSSQSPTGFSPASLFKIRMDLFARDTLDYTWKMKRYAEHLPLLARAALDPGATPDMKRRILDIFRDHAAELEKYIGKLYVNIEKATPRPFNEPRAMLDAGNSVLKGHSSIEAAVWIADEARSQYSSVYEFLYPRDHTVDISELRNPKLLQSLKTLQAITEEFSESIG